MAKFRLFILPVLFDGVNQSLCEIYEEWIMYGNKYAAITSLLPILQLYSRLTDLVTISISSAEKNHNTNELFILRKMKCLE